MKKIPFAMVTAFVFVAWVLLVVAYEKHETAWFGINILFWAVAGSLLTAWGITRLWWFQHPYRSMPGFWYGIAVGGFVLSSLLGIYFVEPVATSGGSGSYGSSYRWRESRSGGYYYYYFGNGGRSASSAVSSGSGGTSTSSDDGEAMAFLLLVLLVIAVVIASAVVPHFWVVGGALLITVMVMMTVREYKFDG